MKTIGLIGGMSWESSVVYYQLINTIVKEKLGGHHSSRSLMYSAEFDEIVRLQHQGDWQTLGEIMVDAAQRLEKGGADFIVLCTNTMHKLADTIEENTRIPFLHIADATAAEIKKYGFKKVGLLGTKFTMEEDFLRKRLQEKHQIEAFIPDQPARERVHTIIYEELIKGRFTDSSRKEFLHIIDDLVANGAEGVILGCTEIPLLVRAQDTDVVLFDTTAIHATNAVEMALS
ncbi:aspartate/glutamate racemase family protein [Pontibacter ruber]|uniref:Aspartate/glutamate racemase family protein n=1 Tax=Pontibacter ruber TaxID=1343895 RepID=A0ABW5CYU4_9BACT|nr:aspartate/glutamate racemase family protein [Pontibacter ruber]